jgi:hypothetical protein
MKQSIKSVIGTSFFGDTIPATVANLRKVLGEPRCEQNSGEEKFNFEWVMETEDGNVFTVYDWKEYRRIKEDEEIEWHIGGEFGSVTSHAVGELEEALKSF